MDAMPDAPPMFGFNTCVLLVPRERGITPRNSVWWMWRDGDLGEVWWPGVALVINGPPESKPSRD